MTFTRWADLATAAPELAETGRVLIYQFGVGLGYLATIRPTTSSTSPDGPM